VVLKTTIMVIREVKNVNNFRRKVILYCSFNYGKLLVVYLNTI